MMPQATSSPDLPERWNGASITARVPVQPLGVVFLQLMKEPFQCPSSQSPGCPVAVTANGVEAAVSLVSEGGKR